MVSGRWRVCRRDCGAQPGPSHAWRPVNVYSLEKLKEEVITRHHLRLTDNTHIEILGKGIGRVGELGGEGEGLKKKEVRPLKKAIYHSMAAL